MLKWLRTRVQPVATEQNVAELKTEVNGENNNVINVVVQGGSTWPLPMRKTVWTGAPQNRENVAALLRWNTRLSPLVGRKAELDQLNDWANSEHPVSIQLICAQGGQGKTRLAAEFATGLDGWRHGWVDLDDFSQAELLTCQGRCLLLVDYPEHKPTQLERLARALERAALQTGQRLRIVLVTREANTVQSVFQNRASSSWLQPPLVLPELPREAGHAMVNNALHWLANFYGCALTAVSLEAFEAWRARHALHQNPLFVTALAIDLAIRSDERSSVDTWLSGPDLLGALVQNEIQWWQKAATGFGAPQSSLTAVMAWATLSGQLTDSDINQTLAADHGWNANDLHALHAALAAVCHRSGEHGWAPLEPDLLAARFIDSWLAATERQGREVQDGTLAQALFHTSDSVGFDVCLNRLHMLAYDQTVRLGLRGSDDAHRLERVLGAWANAHPPLLAALGRGFDRLGIWPGLACLAATVAQVRLAELSPQESEVMRAHYLNNSAVTLAVAGDRASALTSANEAVTIYRRLVKVNPAAYEPDLAGSLSNLSSILSTSGDFASALLPAKEAVEIRRRLAQADPVANETRLAGSLLNLANRLSKSGDLEGALALAKEAVEIYRRLVQTNAAEYEPDLAASLHNLANRLSKSGDRAGALTSVKECVEIFRRLAHANPARYEPDLALSVNNLSNRLSESGDRAGALTSAKEAVTIYNRLAKANPTAYEQGLAGSLSNLSNRLGESGDRAGALVSAQKSVEINRRLAQARPAAHEPDLAMSLNNLANHLKSPGEHAAALASMQEAVAIYRRLAEANPAAHEHDLAMSQSNFANCLIVSGDKAGALTKAQEALLIYRRLAQANPAAYEFELAKSLGMVMVCQDALGQVAAARIVGQEALRLFAALAAKEPKAFESYRDAIQHHLKALTDIDS